jgi:hypothetical protein
LSGLANEFVQEYMEGRSISIIPIESNDQGLEATAGIFKEIVPKKGISQVHHISQ